MKLKERLFHSITYEIGAIVIASIAIIISGKQGQQAVALSLIMAIMAVVWNLIFNAIFDQIIKGAREKRSLNIRIIHALLFEGLLILATTPVIAYMLNLSLWQALLADIGLVSLLMFYTLAFNWSYDILRAKHKQNAIC